MCKIFLFILALMGAIPLTTASSVDTPENVESGDAYAPNEAVQASVESNSSEEYSQLANSPKNATNTISDEQTLKSADDSLSPDAQDVAPNANNLENQDQSISDDQLSQDVLMPPSRSEKVNQKGAALIDKFVNSYQEYAPSVFAGVGGMAVTAAANTAAPGVGTAAGMASVPLLKVGAGIATKVTGEIIRTGSKGALALGTSGASLISKTAKSTIGQSVPSSLQNSAKKVKTKVDHAMSLAKSVLGNLTGGLFSNKK